jgi:DeoR family transcriptional regulator, aga operon transcriptional repressor
VNLHREAYPPTVQPVRQEVRLSSILATISETGSVGVAELAERFQVSSATIRRDLEALEEQRLLARTHGGAVAHGVVYELPLRYKAARHEEEKRRIAAAAATRVTDGMAVGLTGGTTCTEVARALVEHERLTVVTNALNIAAELAIRRTLKLVVTGGTARPESYELVGPIAEQALEGFQLDVAIVGVDGIDAAHGCTTHHEVEAHTNATLLERAREVIVVADASKVGAAAFARICPIGRVQRLITDHAAGPVALGALREAGVHVVTV